MPLLNNKFHYAPLIRNDTPSGRLYSTPDGSRVSSVTTILDKTKSDESRIALANWRKSVGDKKAQEITTEAASRGTRMHKFLEDYVKSDTIVESVSNPYAKQGLQMAKIVISEGMQHVSEVWGSEVPLYFPGLYAGTTDAVGVWKGAPAVLDFKQSNKLKKREYIEDYFTQLSAYILAHNEVHGTNIDQGVIMMCTKDFVYQEFSICGPELEYYKNKWWDRVKQFYS